MTATKSPRILIVKLGALGDLFFTLPALNTFQKAFENCHIDWLVSSSMADVLSGFSEIKNVIPVETDTFLKGSFLSRIWNTIRLRKRIGRYDAILLLHRHPAYLIPLLGKGPIFQLTRGSTLSNLFVRSTPVAPLTTHESLAIQKTTNGLVAALKGKETSEWQINYRRQPQDKIFVHIGGGDNFKTEFKLKRWPKMHELLESLTKTRREKIVLVGAPNERSAAEEICRNINSQQIENLVGKTTLPELVREIGHAKIFIGPDSGPLHIADQLGIPSVGIYGPTSPISWGLIAKHSRTISKPVACHPCYKDDGYFPECPNGHRCMRELAPSEVMNTIESILKEIG